jgi:hypothetical protein
VQEGQETPSTLYLGIYSEIFGDEGDNKQNEYERADNVSPPKWPHFLSLLYGYRNSFDHSLSMMSCFLLFSLHIRITINRCQAKPHYQKAEKATNLHSHHKSNGSEKSSDYGRKKKEEVK